MRHWIRERRVRQEVERPDEGEESRTREWETGWERGVREEVERLVGRERGSPVRRLRDCSGRACARVR